MPKPSLGEFVAQERRRRPRVAAEQQVSKLSKQHKRVMLYLRPEQHRALKMRAAELGRDQSALVRELLDDFLKTGR